MGMGPSLAPRLLIKTWTHVPVPPQYSVHMHGAPASYLAGPAMRAFHLYPAWAT